MSTDLRLLGLADLDDERLVADLAGRGVGRALGEAVLGLGAPVRAPPCRHGLAGHQPAVVTHLAAAGLWPTFLRLQRVTGY